MIKNRREIKKKCILTTTIILLFISIFLRTFDALGKESNYEIDYEYVNIKDMAEANVTEKSNTKSIIETLFTGNTTNGVIQEVSLPTKETNKVEAVQTPVVKESQKPKQVWRLPTQMGRVTQNPHYGHAALDITSPRGSNEYIFPVANGKVTGVYTDPNGALVVTILHDINGKKYTSQYAHLSSFAKGLYVGKQVTVNDALGRMGTTGYSTGIHLHLAVVDCALFDKNDKNCSDLNKFFRYANLRVSQGDWGLGSHIKVPVSWNSR